MAINSHSHKVHYKLSFEVHIFIMTGKASREFKQCSHEILLTHREFTQVKRTGTAFVLGKIKVHTMHIYIIITIQMLQCKDERYCFVLVICSGTHISY